MKSETGNELNNANPTMKQIEVVAAVIRKNDHIFATQRGYGDWKDWWEFPGGKMEQGETPEVALKGGDLCGRVPLYCGI